MITSSYYSTAWQLLSSHMKIFKLVIKNKVINASIFVSCSLLVATYLLPKLGINPQFGTFMFAGLYATTGFFEVFPSAVQLVADFEGDMETNYYLTLPLPAWVTLATKTLFFSICSATLSFLSIPMGLIVLWKSGDFSQLNIFYFILITLLNSLFYGAFTLFMTSLIPNLLELDNIWMRFVFPLWILGGFEFSWNILYSIAPRLAYINLLNPMTYVMEGTRAAVLGQTHYLPFWGSAISISLFSILFFGLAVIILRKRLDFIL